MVRPLRFMSTVWRRQWLGHCDGGKPGHYAGKHFHDDHKPFGFTGGDAEDMRTYADLSIKLRRFCYPLMHRKPGKPR